MDLLKSYEAKGTFFCVGNNIEQYPELFERILEEGHSIGNHSFDHKNGWKTNNYTYLKGYVQCQALIDSNLYRPPYGKITKSQAQAIKKRSKIVMWDVLSGDFDTSSSPEQCTTRVLKHAEPGSIIVFHDSVKAQKNMLPSLEACLSHFKDEGFTFLALPMS